MELNDLRPAGLQLLLNRVRVLARPPNERVEIHVVWDEPLVLLA